MKKVTNTRYALEYFGIAFLGYLLISLIYAVITASEYRAVLCSQYQMVMVMCVYWWLPLPRIADLENQTI